MLGTKTVKHLKIYYAPLIQLILIISWSVFYNTTTLIPEIIMIAPVSLIIVWFMRKMSEDDLTVTTGDVVKLAAIAGFGTAIKLDYFPLVFLPVFFIKDWKKLIAYWPLSLMFFVLFAFPILHKRFFFIDWVKGLLTHSGKYGSGDQQFVNWTDFFNNLKDLFDFYQGVFIALIVLTIILVLSFMNTKLFNYNKIRTRIAFGILSTTLVHVFIVCKHFGMLYVLPLIYLTPFVLILILEYIPAPGRIKKYTSYVLTLVIIYFFIGSYKNVMSWKVPQLNSKKIACEKVRSNIGDTPFLIMDQPYNFYFHESPLLFGLFFQGAYSKEIKKELLKIYPHSYVFDYGKKKFFLWGDLYSFEELLQTYDQVNLYMNKKSFQYPDFELLDTTKYNAQLRIEDDNYVLYKIRVVPE